MPLHFSAAHSSRVNKRKSSNSLFKPSSSSPLKSFNQRKPVQRSISKPETSEREHDLFDERLEEIGLVPSLASDLSLRDVVQVMQYAQSHMFDPLPEGGGFNSTRIAELLNFRRSLPQTVTVTHVHALITSPTAAEKEISELMRACVLKKIVIPGRGTGGSDVSEGLILYSEMKKLLDRTDAVDETLRGKCFTVVIGYSI